MSGRPGACRHIAHGQTGRQAGGEGGSDHTRRLADTRRQTERRQTGKRRSGATPPLSVAAASLCGCALLHSDGRLRCDAHVHVHVHPCHSFVSADTGEGRRPLLIASLSVSLSLLSLSLPLRPLCPFASRRQMKSQFALQQASKMAAMRARSSGGRAGGGRQIRLTDCVHGMEIESNRIGMICLCVCSFVSAAPLRPAPSATVAAVAADRATATTAAAADAAADRAAAPGAGTAAAVAGSAGAGRRRRADGTRRPSPPRPPASCPE